MNRDNWEQIVTTALAAYGLLKLFEHLSGKPPRPTVVVLQGEEAKEFLKVLDEAEE